MSEIKTILVLVELENGNAHQVLASKTQKEIALQILKNEDKGVLMLDQEIMPITLEYSNPKQETQ